MNLKYLIRQGTFEKLEEDLAIYDEKIAEEEWAKEKQVGKIIKKYGITEKEIEYNHRLFLLRTRIDCKNLDEIFIEKFLRD